MGDRRRSDDINLGAQYGAPRPETGGLPRPDPTRGPVFVSHEAQLRRDVEIINARTVAELGPLPPGGLPVQNKRKPGASYQPLPAPTDQEAKEDETMKLSQAVAAAVMGVTGMLAGAQAGCTPASQEKPKVEYKQNPAPTQTYELRMRIDDAPGEFKRIQGFMQFDVVNRECLPPPKDNPAGYSSPVPYHVIPFDLRPTANGEYVATVFTDGMIDEDYHGYGVCRWRLLNVQALLQATGTEGETRFHADLFDDELTSGKTKTLYYWKARYPREEGFDDFPESGDNSLAQVPFDKRDEFFKVNIAVERFMK